MYRFGTTQSSGDEYSERLFPAYWVAMDLGGSGDSAFNHASANQLMDAFTVPEWSIVSARRSLFAPTLRHKRYLNVRPNGKIAT